MKKAFKIYLDSNSDKSQIMLVKHYQDFVDIHKVNRDGVSLQRIASIPVDILKAMCEF